VDEQPGFVIEGTRVALGPLRMDLVPTYSAGRTTWRSPTPTAGSSPHLEATRERIAGRSGKPEFCDFTV
jgi:hypothetical protein